MSPNIICLSKGIALGIPLSLMCMKKSTFPKGNWKEVEIYRTSQALNSCAMRRAISLLRYLKSSWVQNQLLMNRTLLKELFSSLQQHPQIFSIDILGFTVCIHFSKKIRLSGLIKIFKHLLSQNVQCRFPEKWTLIFVFPFDITYQDAQHVFSILQQVLG